ncbi:MAG: SURF1 family protein [Alphaproteobacteria bacterium]
MKSKKNLSMFSFFTLLTLIILFLLGSWQIDRRSQKHSLIDQVEYMTNLPPVDFLVDSNISDFNINDWKYRVVKVSGSFDFTKELHVFANLSDPKGKFRGAGYWIFNPFLIENGDYIFVNRGFVPQSLIGAYKERRKDRQEKIVIKGYIKGFEKTNAFTPDSDFVENILYSVNVTDMKNIFNIENALPFVIDIYSSKYGDLPQAGETRLKFNDNHLSYAITWYGLAIVLIVVYFVYRKRNNIL